MTLSNNIVILDYKKFIRVHVNLSEAKQQDRLLSYGVIELPVYGQ